MICASAPGRAGIVGNPTDGYGGTVLSTSLAERATVRITQGDGIHLDICGDQEAIRGSDDLGLTDRFTDVAKAVLQTFPDAVERGQFRLTATTTIPMQAGLAGSTAMLVALLGGVLRFLEIPLNRYEIAELARRIEFDLMGVTCGFQDQYMAAFGGLNYLDFRDKRPGIEDDPIFATVESLEEIVPLPPLVIANTGVQRRSGTVHKGLRERWLADDKAIVAGYERIGRLAREGKKALLAGDWPCLGETMNENHAIQRELGSSGAANEALIAAATRAGALGAKLAGAGQGGTIIVLHPDEERMARALREAGAVNVMRVVPSEGLVVESEY